MQLQKEKLALKKALSADLDFGLQWLDAWILKNTDAYTETLVHRSNYQTLKSDLRKQVLDPDTAHRKTAALRYALMSLVDELSEQEVDQEFDHTGFWEKLRQKEAEKQTDTEIDGGKPNYGKRVVGILLTTAIGALIWVIAQNWRPGSSQQTTFDLNLVIYGDSAKSTIIRAGTLRLLYKGKPESLPIGQDGRVVWSQVPNDSRTENFQINPEVEDFQKNQLSLQIPEQGNVLEVILEPIRHQSKVRGNILFKGKAVEGLLVELEGFETRTDEKGDFEQVLPVKRGTEIRIRVFKDNQPIYNGTERISNQIIPITID